MSIHLKITFILLLVGLSSCGTNRVSDASQGNAETTSQADITRPPSFVNSASSASNNSENDPDETISLEEWQKEQLENE